MSDLPPKDPAENCNARKTDGSGYCGQPAGWGTDHNGHGRCKFHGGNTTNQEKGLIGDLEDAAADAAVAYRLKMKHVKRKAEAGEHEDIDWGELDRLARTAFDRTGTGPTETTEVTGDGDAPLNVTVSRDAYDGDE
jgi:hypothetical protein